MTTTATALKCPHLYVDSDLLDGQSLLDWRRDRHARRPRPSLLRRLTGSAT